MADVRFTNATADTVYVAYMYRDHSCRDACGDIWNVEGWIVLAPGQVQHRANPTGNRWFYYYGESSSGMWHGPYRANVRLARFDKCNCLGVTVSHGPQPWYDVGMRAVDLDRFDGVRFV